VFGCFWFEQRAALDAIAAFEDNILFESDYPHPMCQHPGPRTPARRPRDYAADVLAPLSTEVVRKVLHDNAAAIYGLP
jgi:predicted TIM-barrel fold metal-dependent hydrolase